MRCSCLRGLSLICPFFTSFHFRWTDSPHLLAMLGKASSYVTPSVPLPYSFPHLYPFVQLIHADSDLCATLTPPFCLQKQMGFPTTLSMNLGMLVGWGVLSPLAKHKGWAPGDVSSSTDGARGWILWVALAIMASESLISLLPILISTSRILLARYRLARERNGRPSRLYDQHNHDEASSSSPRTTPFDYESPTSNEPEDPEPPHRLVPTTWVIPGLILSSVSGIVIVYYLFGNEGIRPWATALGFVLASLLALLGVRALGETDLNPVSGIGKISQLLFAVLQPGNGAFCCLFLLLFFCVRFA